MSATHRGMVFTLLTGLAAGAAATAWDDRQIAMAVGATLLLQVLAMVSFLLGSRRRKAVQAINSDDASKNQLTAAFKSLKSPRKPAIGVRAQPTMTIGLSLAMGSLLQMSSAQIQ